MRFSLQYFQFTNLAIGFFWVLNTAFYGSELNAQAFVGLNVGPGVGRTIDVFGMIHPKSQEWLSFTMGGGYTLPGPLYFTRKMDCVSNYNNSGYHVRLGARHSLTTDHHKNFLFYGLNLVLSGQNESITQGICDNGKPPGSFQAKGIAVGGAINAGYSYNPTSRFHKPKVHLDMGLQAGIPFYRTFVQPGSSSYLPGLGYGKTGRLGIYFELVLIVRYEFWHNIFGYSRPKKFIRK